MKSTLPRLACRFLAIAAAFSSLEAGYAAATGADRAMPATALDADSAARVVGRFATTAPRTRADVVARLPASRPGEAQASAKPTAGSAGPPAALAPPAAAAVLPNDLRHYLVYRFLTRD